MSGVVRRPDLKDRLIEAYAGIPGMDKYAQGLTNGGMVRLSKCRQATAIGRRASSS